MTTEITEQTQTAVQTAPAEAPQEPVLTRNKYADKMNRPKRRIPKPVKIILGLAILGGLIAGGVYLVKRSGQEPEQMTEQTAFATRGFLETYIEGDGSTAAKKRVEVGKDLKGIVTDIQVSVGDQVTAGQTLFVVNPKETRKELDDAIDALDDAQEALRKARDAVNKLTVTAPFTGKLLPPADGDGNARELQLNIGEELPGGTELGTLVDDTAMKLTLYFSYAYVNEIGVGATANVSIPSNMSNVTGTVEKVEQIEKISDDGTKLFRVVVEIPNPGALKSGMVATAAIGSIMPAESGTLEYAREQRIVAETGGKIARLTGMSYYRYGAGDAILSLTNEDAAASLESQQKQVASKQEEIDRLTTLIANSTVVAPIDGVVVSMPIVVEEELNGSTVPCVVADMTAIVVNADISMADVAGVAPGQMATITMYTSEGDQMFTGTVQSVAIEATQNSNSGQGSMPTFLAVIELDPIEGQTLRPDYSVQYQITTAQSMDCITVPSSAVVNTETGTAVFARQVEGQTFENAQPLPEGTEGIPEDFVLVPVTVGISDANNTEILEGIEEGTEVFLSGPADLYADTNMDGGFAIAVG